MAIPPNAVTAGPDFTTVLASVPGLGEFPFRVHSCPDQYISRSLIQEKIWEPFETEVFRRLCQPGDVVADLGANIGWYSIIAAHLVGEQGKVFAFEPDSANFEILRENVLASPNAQQMDIFKLALSDFRAQSKLYLCPSNLGDHRLFDDGSPRAWRLVDTSTLDVFFAEIPRKPTLVKSDTQGSEARILRGAQRLFADNWRPILILEFWPFGLSKSGSDPVELIDVLVSLDYGLYEVTEQYPRLIPTGRTLSERLKDDLSPHSEQYINLLCLPRNSERLSLVADLVEPSGSSGGIVLR
jgi:FkbM family methyltransferase